jgi:hypothetical protein
MLRLSVLLTFIVAFRPAGSGGVEPHQHGALKGVREASMRRATSSRLRISGRWMTFAA